MTPAEWAAGCAFLLVLLVLSLRRPLFLWADARRARRVAFNHDHDRENDERAD